MSEPTGCTEGKIFVRNPAWKTPSQRVMGLITGCVRAHFGSDLYYKIRDLAADLEKEEKGEGK